MSFESQGREAGNSRVCNFAAVDLIAASGHSSLLPPRKDVVLNEAFRAQGISGLNDDFHGSHIPGKSPAKYVKKYSFSPADVIYGQRYPELMGHSMFWTPTHAV